MSRWVKGMLKGASIDTKRFSPHSTRSASTSMAKRVHLTIDFILEEGWRSMTSYAKHYDTPIKENILAKATLQSVNVKTL